MEKALRCGFTSGSRRAQSATGELSNGPSGSDEIHGGSNGMSRPSGVLTKQRDYFLRVRVSIGTSVILTNPGHPQCLGSKDLPMRGTVLEH